MTRSGNDAELIDAIGLQDNDSVRRIVRRLPDGFLNRPPDSLSYLAYAVDVVADAYVQSGVEIELDVVETLLEAGADPDLGGPNPRFLSARALALRSGQERLIRLFSTSPEPD